MSKAELLVGVLLLVTVTLGFGTVLLMAEGQEHGVVNQGNCSNPNSDTELKQEIVNLRNEILTTAEVVEKLDKLLAIAQTNQPLVIAVVAFTALPVLGVIPVLMAKAREKFDC